MPVTLLAKRTQGPLSSGQTSTARKSSASSLSLTSSTPTTGSPRCVFALYPIRHTMMISESPMTSQAQAIIREEPWGRVEMNGRCGSRPPLISSLVSPLPLLFSARSCRSGADPFNRSKPTNERRKGPCTSEMPREQAILGNRRRSAIKHDFSASSDPRLLVSICFSLSLLVPPCFSLSLLVSPCFSLFLLVSPCLSLFLPVSPRSIAGRTSTPSSRTRPRSAPPR